MSVKRYKITDIGPLKGDVLLFGGPYSNLHAVQALIRDTIRIWPDNRICTGDVVAYCALPRAATELVFQTAPHVVAGNCERQIATGASDCGCGFEAGSSCDLASQGWFPFASRKSDEGLRGRFADLPDMLVFTHAGLRYAVIHGGLTDISRFIWPNSPEPVFADEIAAIEHEVGRVDGVIAGHSGVAFERHVAGRLWINAGVIGMPPHDGRPDTRYAVLSADGVRFHTLSYDYDAAALAMQQARLTQGYEVALKSGVWPSEDVLPPALRR